MTRADMLLYLISEGYNEKALKLLSFEELKHIVIINIAINWGEIKLTDIK